MNRTLLSASVAEQGTLRHTPAGLPVLDVWLEHDSQLEEAGQMRRVRARLRAVAIGPVAERLASRPLGAQWRFEGFLAGSGAQASRVVFHIQDFQQD
ncbi:MAG: primosomal replication protein N [Rhodocyclaceae bacterium]|nr:primosomal replication protein N [Rhodocyclaceae bacterium]